MLTKNREEDLSIFVLTIVFPYNRMHARTNSHTHTHIYIYIYIYIYLIVVTGITNQIYGSIGVIRLKNDDQCRYRRKIEDNYGCSLIDICRNYNFCRCNKRETWGIINAVQSCRFMSFCYSKTPKCNIWEE